MTDCRLDVGKGNVAKGEVSDVAVGVTWSGTTGAVSAVCVVVSVARTSGDRSSTCVVEINVAEDVTVICTACSSTVVSEGKTLPISTVLTLEENLVSCVTGYSDGVTCTINGDTLAGSDLDDGSWLNGQISTTDGQEVTVRADSVWRTFVVPNTFDVVVGTVEIAVDVSTLAFEWHCTDINTTVSVRVVVTVVASIVTPPWCNRTWSSSRVARVWQRWHVGTPCGNTSLESSGSTVNHVEVTETANSESVVAVITVKGLLEVVKLEARWQIDVCVTSGLVLVPVVAVGAVVTCWTSVGGSRDDFCSVGNGLDSC